MKTMKFLLWLKIYNQNKKFNVDGIYSKMFAFTNKLKFADNDDEEFDIKSLKRFKFDMIKSRQRQV